MPLPRISGRLGQTIDLNITFYRNGIPTDPFAIRRVSIYKSAVQPENLVAEFSITYPFEPEYPAPLSRESDSSGILPGVFHLYWDVPKTGIPVPDIFFDVWSFFEDDPDIGPSGTVEATEGVTAEKADLDDESRWISCCNEFFLYPDGTFCDDGLTNIRLGFEAIDIKFYQPEVRTLEIGITPLPLYDYDYNKVAPLIPLFKPTLSLMTDNCELLIDRAPMRMGLRQGSYRSNPFVAQYRFDSNLVYKGSYKYQMVLQLPNGETRASPWYSLLVA